MTPYELIKNLEYTANKHRNDQLFTGETSIFDMAKDSIRVVKDLLDRLTWIPVTERLPLPPDYDWVLVRAIFEGESEGETVPHVAELRDGKWYGRACEGPLEETLAIKVVAWFDMQQLITRTSFAHNYTAKIENKELTFGDIMRAFARQFPSIVSQDMRPNGANELYIWLDGPANLIAKYHPEDDTFEVRTTKAPWGVLEMAFKKQADVLVRYCEEDVKMTEELFRKKAQEDFDRSNSPNV